jgi:hypothetical protein
VNATTASGRPSGWPLPPDGRARECFSDAVSAGLRKAASASLPRVSASSISPWTHDSGEIQARLPFTQHAGPWCRQTR